MKTRKKPNGLTVVSLFAGAGGLDIAACSTGKVSRLVSTDANATFLETTAINIPTHFSKVQHTAIVADARTLQGSALVKAAGRNIDLVMGGPPCDDFARWGRQRGLTGDKGPLLFEFVRLISDLSPRAFLFENVANLAGQFRVAFEQFVGKCHDAGFHLKHAVLKACDYGAPTLRERVFVVGFASPETAARFMFPEPSHGDADVANLFVKSLRQFVTVRDVLGDVPDIAAPRAHQFANHTGRAHRPETIAHIATVPQGKEVKRSFRYRAPWDGLCRSLTAGLDGACKAYIHPHRDREMSPREYARLHGFPDSWLFCGTWHNSIKQVANAVPIPMGVAVAQSVISCLNDSSEADGNDLAVRRIQLGTSATSDRRVAARRSNRS